MFSIFVCEANEDKMKNKLKMPISHVFELLVRSEVSKLVEVSVANYKFLCSKEDELTDERENQIMKHIIEDTCDSVVSRLPTYEEYLLNQGLERITPIGLLFSKKPPIKLRTIVRYKHHDDCVPHEYKVVGRSEDGILLKMSTGKKILVSRELFEKDIQLDKIEIIDQFTKFK